MRMLPGSWLAGFTYVLNYTWSKQLENFLRQEFAFDFKCFNNVGNQLTDIDVRQQLTMATVYEVPIGRGRSHMANMNRVLDPIVGGWNTNMMLDWNSGVPTGLNTGWDFICAGYHAILLVAAGSFHVPSTAGAARKHHRSNCGSNQFVNRQEGSFQRAHLYGIAWRSFQSIQHADPAGTEHRSEQYAVWNPAGGPIQLPEKYPVGR